MIFRFGFGEVFEPQTGKGIEEDGFWGFLGDPVVLQVGAAILFLLVFLRFFWVLKRSLRRTRARKQLTDYLEAVENVFSGDAKSAVPKLERVLSVDPENLGARLALARAHLDLKRPAEAHRRNLEAIEVFGAEGAGVEFAMIRSLIAAGEEGEALERLERAEERFPNDKALLELSWELHEECGLFELAVRAGKKILAERPNEENRKRLARTSAKAGTHFLERGKEKEALIYFKESLSLNSDEIQAKRGILALDPRKGEGGIEHSLLSFESKDLKDGAPQHSLEKVGESACPVFPDAWRDVLTDAQCPACHAPRNPDWEHCRSCGDAGPSVYSNENYLRVLANPGEALDGIERNETWIRTQLEKAQLGDEKALKELEGAGEDCLQQLIHFLCTTPQPLPSLFGLCLKLSKKNPDVFIQAVKRFGEDPSGFWDFLRFETPGRSLLAELVGDLGSTALEAFRRERDSAESLSKPQSRSMILDYFIGLKDAQEFDALFARFSPFEILRHLNQSSPSRVADLMVVLAASEGPSRSLFVEEALGCEEGLLLALVRARGEARESIMKWVLAKGPRPSLIYRLVEDLDKDDTGVLERVLNGFAWEGRKIMVERFADPRLSARCSEILRRVLLHAGPGVIADLCRCFGSAPAPSDDRIRSLMACFGEDAIPEILRAYKQHKGLLAFLGIQQNLARHAKSLLLRVLAQVDPRRESFGEIEAVEKDPELLSLARFLCSQKGNPNA
jgi:tetratricopeptide (TPR) repeat protein